MKGCFFGALIFGVAAYLCLISEDGAVRALMPACGLGCFGLLMVGCLDWVNSRR